MESLLNHLYFVVHVLNHHLLEQILIYFELGFFTFFIFEAISILIINTDLVTFSFKLVFRLLK